MKDKGTIKGSTHETGITRRDFTKAMAIIGASASLHISGCGSSDSEPPRFLARVDVPEYIEDIDLPVYADFEDSEDNYYALVIATVKELQAAGESFILIDQYENGVLYLLGNEEVEGAREKASKLVKVLYDDGEHIIARYRAELSDILPELGFDLKLISRTPTNITSADVKQKAIVYQEFNKDLRIEAMLNAVTETNVKTYTEELSGEIPIVVEGGTYTFTTRHTKSGEPIRKATQFLFDKLKGMNLNPYFHEWTFQHEGQSLSNRNVIVDIKGQESPDSIILGIAHLDSITDDQTGLAPGADDNASGCVGLIVASSIMRDYSFKRTVRFVFTTGEEQAIFGGEAYARKVRDEGQKIEAVINLDMISYSKVTKPPSKPRQQVKTRRRNNASGYSMDLPIAKTYLRVADIYGINQTIEPIIEDDGELTSDHAPFWENKFPAVWIIEYAESGFINPEMHSKDDRIRIMNMAYYTSVIKAVLGTIAHLAEPVNKP